ncbi:hypothetical protein GGR54DRAFT_634835 [Hypoxylon sp. NC1633]|nr:hypothetical protein GGR54DRAFT_634835 [Hypoxylon sp. NC1633]
MADYIELELKHIEISKADSDISLSVTSLALISGLSSSHSSDEVCRLIQSNRLWLVSPGICRIQIIIDQSQLSNGMEPGLLEYLADVICRCSIWPALGLTVKQEDIHHQPLYDGAPNLFFIIEHPHKASVLLSPPHTPTARLNGIECLFRYQRDAPKDTLEDIPEDGPEASQADAECPDIYDTEMDDHAIDMALHVQYLDFIEDSYQDGCSSDYWESPAIDNPMNQVQQRWDDLACLAQMALCLITGVRKRLSGLRLSRLDNKPSLLEIAPAIWNAYYLKAVTTHSNNIPIISTILATCSRGQSPSLRTKTANLLRGDFPNDEALIGTAVETGLHVYQSSVQQRLWDLLQAKLKPNTRIRKVNTTHWGEMVTEDLEFNPLAVHTIDEFDSSVAANELEDIGRDDFYLDDFDDFPDDYWPLHQLPEYQLYDNTSDPETTSECQQLRYENESMEIVDEDSPMDVARLAEERPDSSLEWSLPVYFPNPPPSSSDESHDTPTTQQEDPDTKTFAMEVDQIQEPEYPHDAGTIYCLGDEQSFYQEVGLYNETQPQDLQDMGSDTSDDRFRGAGKDVMEENDHTKRGITNSRAVKMYRQCRQTYSQ